MLKWVRFVLDVAAAIGGLACATMSVCNPNPNPNGWSLLAWICSLSFMGSLFCRNHEKREPVVNGWTILLAAISVFCLAMLMIIFIKVNPGPLAFEDLIVVSVLTVIGVISMLIAFRLHRSKAQPQNHPDDPKLA